MPQMLEDSAQCPDLKNHKKASALLSQDALLFSLSLSLSLSLFLGLRDRIASEIFFALLSGAFSSPLSWEILDFSCVSL